MNILFLYWIYINSMNISHYGFVCPVNLSNEKYIKVKKKKFFDIFFRKNRYQVFVKYSHLTNIIPIPICKFWNSWTIPISICTKVGSANLFLFLFAGEITIRWSLWHSVWSDDPFWLRFHFEWHSILSDFPFWETFHFE